MFKCSPISKNSHSTLRLFYSRLYRCRFRITFSSDGDEEQVPIANLGDHLGGIVDNCISTINKAEVSKVSKAD
jgi:hypothetical protein